MLISDIAEFSTDVSSLSSTCWFPTILLIYHINCFLAGTLLLCFKVAWVWELSPPVIWLSTKDRTGWIRCRMQFSELAASGNADIRDAYFEFRSERRWKRPYNASKKEAASRREYWTIKSKGAWWNLHDFASPMILFSNREEEWKLKGWINTRMDCFPKRAHLQAL